MADNEVETALIELEDQLRKLTPAEETSAKEATAAVAGTAAQQEAKKLAISGLGEAERVGEDTLVLTGEQAAANKIGLQISKLLEQFVKDSSQRNAANITNELRKLTSQELRQQAKAAGLPDTFFKTLDQHIQQAEEILLTGHTAQIQGVGTSANTADGKPSYYGDWREKIKESLENMQKTTMATLHPYQPGR